MRCWFFVVDSIKLAFVFFRNPLEPVMSFSMFCMWKFIWFLWVDHCLYQKGKAKLMLPFPCKVMCLILLDEITALYLEHVHLLTMWDACIYTYMVCVRERERERSVNYRDEGGVILKDSQAFLLSLRNWSAACRAATAIIWNLSVFPSSRIKPW